MKKLLFTALLTFIIISVNANPADNFWSWMSKNETMLYDDFDKPGTTQKIYNELIKCSQGLAVIIPSYGGSKYEFVISTNTNPTNKKTIDDLFASKPKFNKIKVTKYLQKGMAFIDLQVIGKAVPLENIGVIADKNGNKYDLVICSGKFGLYPDDVLLNDIFYYFDYMMGEEKIVNKINSASIQRVSLVSPEVFFIGDIDEHIK